MIGKHKLIAAAEDQLRLKALLAVVAMALPQSANADACMNGATSQTAMNLCAKASADASEAQLASLVSQIEGRLAGNPEAQNLFNATQNAWEKFRDAECDFQSSGVSGGSIQPMIYIGCSDGVNLRRIEELKYYADCEEGDLSCPAWSR